MQDVFFKIADHILQVKVPSGFPLMNYLPSFKDFVVNELSLNQEPVLQVVVSFGLLNSTEEHTTVLADTSPIWGDGFRFEEGENHYYTSMIVDKEKVVMVSSKEFESSTIYLTNVSEDCFLIIGWFLMVAFGQGVLLYNTVLIHASTVERNNNEAYAFLGKSGTGKSTHSQLWLKHLEGFTLLNDDNPAIRIFDDSTVYIYGTPWSGKTKCYRNLKVELKGFVRLRQALVNRFELKEDSNSLIALLPSCTGIRWNKKLFNKMVDTVELIIKVVPIGFMECLIDREAVDMSYSGIKLIK